jgi:hypothetical protein
MATPTKPKRARVWHLDPSGETADESVFDRTTSPDPNALAERLDEDAPVSESSDEPPTKPQAKANWHAARDSDRPTPRAASLPSFEPDLQGGTPLGLADQHERGGLLTAPGPMTGDADSVPPLPTLDEATRDMQACYEVGDFSGALSAAERVLEINADDVEANRYAQSCREVLTQMFSARLSPLDRTVSIAVSPEQIRWLSLDHKSGFLLSLIDGSSSIEELLDISGMPKLDALRILLTLAQQKVIALT